MLANTVMDIAPAVVLGGEGGELALVPGGALKVGRTRQQLRDGIGEKIDDVARELDAVLGRLLPPGALAEGPQRLLPAFRQPALAQTVEQSLFLQTQGRSRACQAS